MNTYRKADIIRLVSGYIEKLEELHSEALGNESRVIAEKIKKREVELERFRDYIVDISTELRMCKKSELVQSKCRATYESRSDWRKRQKKTDEQIDELLNNPESALFRKYVIDVDSVKKKGLAWLHGSELEVFRICCLRFSIESPYILGSVMSQWVNPNSIQSDIDYFRMLLRKFDIVMEDYIDPAFDSKIDCVFREPSYLDERYTVNLLTGKAILYSGHLRY